MMTNFEEKVLRAYVKVANSNKSASMVNVARELGYSEAQQGNPNDIPELLEATLKLTKLGYLKSEDQISSTVIDRAF